MQAVDLAVDYVLVRLWAAMAMGEPGTIYIYGNTKEDVVVLGNRLLELGAKTGWTSKYDDFTRYFNISGCEVRVSVWRDAPPLFGSAVITFSEYEYA